MRRAGRPLVFRDRYRPRTLWSRTPWTVCGAGRVPRRRDHRRPVAGHRRAAASVPGGTRSGRAPLRCVPRPAPPGAQPRDEESLLVARGGIASHCAPAEMLTVSGPPCTAVVWAARAHGRPHQVGSQPPKPSGPTRRPPGPDAWECLRGRTPVCSRDSMASVAIARRRGTRTVVYLVCMGRAGSGGAGDPPRAGFCGSPQPQHFWALPTLAVAPPNRSARQRQRIDLAARLPDCAARQFGALRPRKRSASPWRAARSRTFWRSGCGCGRRETRHRFSRRRTPTRSRGPG